jgi:hypothetical protein
MVAAWLLLRSEWRRRWGALLAVAVLLAFGGGATLAALAGARRADTAFDRFLAQTHAPNIAVTSEGGGPGSDLSVLDGVPARLSPQVAAVPGVLGAVPVAWYGAALRPDPPLGFFAVGFGPAAGTVQPDDYPYVEGRAPAGPLEVAINEEMARTEGFTAGTHTTLYTLAPDQIGTWIPGAGQPESPRGPTLDVVITGIFRGQEDISDNPEPALALSGAFRDAYGGQVIHCDCALDVSASAAHLATTTASVENVVRAEGMRADAEPQDFGRRVRHAVSLEVNSLRLVALIGFVATMLVVVQAMARLMSGNEPAQRTMRALGFTRGQSTATLVLWVAPALALGVIGAAGVAIALSPLFPRALARRAEVHTGIRVDAAILLIGGLGLLIATAALAAAISSTTQRRHARQASAGRSFPVSPPAALGFAFASDAGRERARLATVAAVAATAVAAAGITAVALVTQSADDARTNPRRYAADWDVHLADPRVDVDQAIAAAVADPSIDAVAVAGTVGSEPLKLLVGDRSGSGTPIAFKMHKGSMGPIMLHGRAAISPDDAVVGDALARQLHIAIGDTISFDAGPPGLVSYHVTGLGRTDTGDEIDTAVVVSSEGLTRLYPEPNWTPDDPQPLARLARGANDDDRRRIEALGFVPVAAPSIVGNLGQLGSVPFLLAAFLGILGLGGLVNALVVAVRRRRHDIAVARALGFTPRQAAAAVRWQAVALIAAGLIVGVPLGLVVGRVAWRAVARGVGVFDVLTIPLGALVLVPLTALLAGVAVSSLPGHRAATIHPAEILRSE